MFISEQFNIAIISVIVFMYVSKLLDSSKFQLCLCSLDIQANSTKALDISNISPKYYKFANVFSKTKVEVLVLHCSYNLQINLKESVQPPVSLIYSLLVSKQEAPKKFIKENLNMGFI